MAELEARAKSYDALLQRFVHRARNQVVRHVVQAAAQELTTEERAMIAHMKEEVAAPSAAPSDAGDTVAQLRVLAERDPAKIPWGDYGVEIVVELRDEDYGSRGYSARDPEGNLWSFGTYQPEVEDA